MRNVVSIEKFPEQTQWSYAVTVDELLIGVPDVPGVAAVSGDGGRI